MSGVTEAAEREDVVLLDELRRPIGTAAKSEVHHGRTPLHLAFSCYIFDSRDRFLLTRRALHKLTWPGVWTNSCCGHPAPGEEADEAVHRRVGQELGVRVERLRVALPDFRYRAVDASGVVENEVCPVYVAVTRDEPRPDPAEVMDWRWVDWPAFVGVAETASWGISPWAAEQAVLLDKVM